jgi:YegS/Rv2252/BmrU family lipid kinase
MKKRAVAIVNPASGGPLARVLRGLGNVETRQTQGPNHATELTRHLLREGFECVIASGGDGTVNEVVNGFFENGRPLNPDAAVAVLPLGTGGDFRRSLGVTTLDDAIAAIETGNTRTIDLGRITYRDRTGESRTRYFANVVSFGMGGEVAARAKNPLRVFGGKSAFLYATVEIFLRYKAKTVSLMLDGMPAGSHTILNIAIGNGRYHGGGMHVCPRASLDDGLLEVTVIDSLSMLELARDIKVLYSDDLYVHPKTHHYHARRIEAGESKPCRSRSCRLKWTASRWVCCPWRSRSPRQRFARLFRLKAAGRIQISRALRSCSRAE